MKQHDQLASLTVRTLQF